MSNRSNLVKESASLQEEELSLLFKALAEPNRLRILRKLGEGPGRVQDVAQCCSLDLSVISRHLSKMKQAGILESEKKGKEVTYSLRAELAKTLRDLANYLEDCCKC